MNSARNGAKPSTGDPPQLSKSTGEASALGKMVKDAEAERAVRQQVIEEAKQIRSKEMERIRKEEEDAEQVGSLPNSSNNLLSSTTRFPTGSRRASDVLVTSTMTVESSELVRDLRSQLTSLTAKYNEAMFTNAQLDNEKQGLRYEVDFLKDKMEDMEDSRNSFQRNFNTKKRECSYQKMQIEDFQRRLDWLQRQVQARDQLIREHGLVLMGPIDPSDTDNIPEVQSASLATQPGLHSNGHAEEVPRDTRGSSADSTASLASTSSKGMALLSKETASMMNSLPAGDLESRLKSLFSERDALVSRVERLETQVEEERHRADMAAKYESRKNGMDAEDDLKHSLQQARTQSQDYKLQLHRTLQKVTALEGDIIRLEGQAKRYKTIAESCEKQEEELKQEKRKMQRDLRDVQSKLEDLKSENGSLQRKLEKLKTSSGTTPRNLTLLSSTPSSQPK